MRLEMRPRLAAVHQLGAYSISPACLPALQTSVTTGKPKKNTTTPENIVTLAYVLQLYE
jgi:hypothetical protein